MSITPIPAARDPNAGGRLDYEHGSRLEDHCPCLLHTFTARNSRRRVIEMEAEGNSNSSTAMDPTPKGILNLPDELLDVNFRFV